MTSAKIKGWIAIGRFLESHMGAWSRDTLIRLADRKSDPLPVSKFGTRVVADTNELAAWAKRQIVKR